MGAATVDQHLVEHRRADRPDAEFRPVVHDERPVVDHRQCRVRRADVQQLLPLPDLQATHLARPRLNAGGGGGGAGVDCGGARKRRAGRQGSALRQRVDRVDRVEGVGCAVAIPWLHHQARSGSDAQRLAGCQDQVLAAVLAVGVERDPDPTLTDLQHAGLPRLETGGLACRQLPRAAAHGRRHGGRAMGRRKGCERWGSADGRHGKLLGSRSATSRFGNESSARLPPGSNENAVAY
ncbi:hypothetical protein VARIO8X_100027 [Burkholderiales bacterium 8X]|nr:hypothetical protein VARIO8X_100027 [Burkholderiales bacterium 8X]